MKCISFALSLCLVTGSALAQSEISTEIGASGLTATQARLAGLSDPTDADRFALGGVTFLRAIEKSLQLRWQVGMNDSFSELPVLRLPIEPNPNPVPLEPAMIAGMFETLTSDMTEARAALADIPETAEFGVEISLGDVWFDVNANGTRDEGEDLMQIAGRMLLGPRAAREMAEQPELPTIRFDTADTFWLTAYTHFLSGISEVILAYDPTDAITEVLETNAALAELDTEQPPANAIDQQFGIFIDRFAMAYLAATGQPDTDRALAAHGHFLSMIEANRTFWRLVAQETDNQAEWLPNDAQTAAIGIEVPERTGQVWLSVLDDAEALLNGEKLIPYWRLDKGAGLNMQRMFTDPRPLDIVGMVQGYAALPYAEKGERVSGENWTRFERMLRGDAMLFVVFLN